VPGELNDVVAELAAASSRLGSSLHATTAASLADLVRIMNTYYSNLIEGHNTRPRDIVRALAGKFARDEARRNLQREAAAHVRVQRESIERALPVSWVSLRHWISCADCTGSSIAMPQRKCYASSLTSIHS